MLKLGFFTDNAQLAELVGDVERQAGLEVVGTWADTLLSNDDKRKFPDCLSNPEVLYGGIDVGVFSISSPSIFLDVISAAIKNGVHPLVVGLPDLPLSTYNQLSQLCAEMGVELGFSHINRRFGGIHPPLSNPIIAQLTRREAKNLLSQSEMTTTLRFDMATILGLTSSEVRRTRTYVLPQSGDCPTCIMVFIDFFNSSAMTYTLTLKSKVDFFELRLNTADMSMEFCDDDEKLTSPALVERVSTSLFLDDLNNFISCIGIQREPLLGISFVMRTFKLVEAIFQKMAW